MRNRYKQKEELEHANDSKIPLILGIVATFFTGVHYWVYNTHPRETIYKIAPNTIQFEVPDIIPEEVLSPHLQERESRLQSESTGSIRGRLIERFYQLKRKGVIASSFPVNPFCAYNSGDASSLPRNKKDLVCVRNTQELGLYLYDRAASGCDTFAFHAEGFTPNWKTYHDIESKGYLFTDELSTSSPDSEQHVQLQTTDFFHILTALTSERKWLDSGKNGHSPAWADLTPDELKVLDKCLSILEETIQPDMSQSRKAEALALYLCSKLDYHDLRDNTSVFYRHRGKFVTYALMPLIEGQNSGNAICEGYAKTYGLLLTLCGIPSMQVCGTIKSGGGHAWNLVQTEHGWYHVDTTWMDGATINRKYFMCTDSLLKNDGDLSRVWPFSGQLPYPETPTVPFHW